MEGRVISSLQALAEIAKQRQGAGLLSALDTPPLGWRRDGASPDSSPKQDLYTTRMVTSDSGKRELETAV